MYLMTCTRPDLAYPLSILARYVAPGRHRPEHMAAAKRVLRYLCSTSGLGLVLGGRRPVVLTGHANASWADDQATQRSSQGYTFILGSGSVSWRSTRSSSVLGSNCEAEIYAGAMAAQELRWLTYLLTDLGEPPRSPPVLYVDNKAMLALCREHRLEHRTKHIALRYFLRREMQQRGQLRLAYVASEANTADIFTKALPPGDHQRFCTMLGLGHERYFLLVVDDYLRYTTVFPLRSKDRGGEFSSDFLRAFCRAEGIRQTFTLPASPQQNGIAERRIGMVIDVARTSMIHAAAPHFLWPFAVQYAARQINLQPCVSLPETTPTLRWTGKVGNASAFRVWGSRAFVDDASADKLSSCAVPCVFLGFPPDAPGWQFYHPTSRRVRSSHDVTFDESVSYYRLFPYRTASLTPPPLFLASGTTPPQGPAPSGVSQVDPAEPVKVAVDSGAARGAEPADAGTGGAEPGGAAPKRVEPGGAEPGGTASGGAEPARAESGGSPGVPLRREPLSPQRLREWYARRCRCAAGAAGSAAGAGATGGAAGVGGTGGAAGAGAAGAAAGAGAAGGATGAGVAGGAAGPGGARTGGTGAPGAGGAAGVGAARLRPYYVPLLQQVLGLPPSPGPTPPLRSPPPVQSQSQLQPTSPLPVSFCTGRCVSRPRPPPVPRTHSMNLRPSTTPQRVCLPSPPASSLPYGPDPEPDSLRAACPTGTCFLATAVTEPLFETTVASALVTELVDFAAACPLDYVARLLVESESASVCPPSVGGESALSTDVLEDRQEEFECFAAAVPPLVSLLLAPEGDPDALDIPTPRSYAEAIEGPNSPQWQAPMDAEMASWKSTGTYVDEVPPPGANIVSGLWIFRVKRPPGSPPVFKARYVARGFIQRQGVDFFHTFSPTLKMTTLWVLLHVAAHRDYELHSLEFNTAFLQGSLHEEIYLRRPVYGLRQAPREWYDTLRTTLPALGNAPSTLDPSLFLRTDTTLPPFYVLVYVDDLVFATTDTEALAHVKSELQKRHTCTGLGELTSYLGLKITRDRAQRTITLTQSHMVQQVLQRFDFTYSSPQSTPLPNGHSLSAPPLDESIEPNGQYPELVGCLITSGMGLVRGGRARVVLTGHADASWSSRSSSVLSSNCEAEIYAGAMAAQELRWLTYLLTDLGEAPRSPPVLYVDNKAMLALCQEHRLEHRTKHIALRYFLAREL
ncbi:unnamed protein product [Closterium sp. NIES-53]